MAGSAAQYEKSSSIFAKSSLQAVIVNNAAAEAAQISSVLILRIRGPLKTAVFRGNFENAHFLVLYISLSQVPAAESMDVQ
ncbi:hypothetical protein [Treponema socranskii]|uniref:hypothetical protein n=1 Tax=Treponema socranskii TaxID=53419 RepID=UPI003D8BA686